MYKRHKVNNLQTNNLNSLSIEILNNVFNYSSLSKKEYFNIYSNIYLNINRDYYQRSQIITKFARNHQLIAEDDNIILVTDNELYNQLINNNELYNLKTTECLYLDNLDINKNIINYLYNNYNDKFISKNKEQFTHNLHGYIKHYDNSYSYIDDTFVNILVHLYKYFNHKEKISLNMQDIQKLIDKFNKLGSIRI